MLTISCTSTAPLECPKISGTSGFPDLAILTPRLSRWWLPTPDNFQNRYLTTGGFAYAINAGEGNANLGGGVQYGAVAGITDGGFGGFAATFDEVFWQNDTIDYEPLFIMGYKGICEQTIIGKAFTQQFFNSSSGPYTYYQSCSEGGREGWSQVQRFGGVYDGGIAGAPAFRYGQQQVQHLFSNVVEQTLDY